MHTHTHTTPDDREDMATGLGKLLLEGGVFELMKAFHCRLAAFYSFYKICYGR